MIGAGPSSADSTRDAQWVLTDYRADDALWPVSQGGGVTVAVIDSGVMKDHQDLVGQVLAGADFTGEGSDGTVDKDGHGTGMASLIAGHGHGDNAGIMGLAPKAKILPVRVSWSTEGAVAQKGLAQGIRFAVDHGSKVVNMSIGGYSGADQETRAAVKYAVDHDVVLVASTGNSGQQAAPVEYPAAYPGVVAVGAVDRQGKAWEKSTYGPETTLAGPGAEIYRASAKSAAGYGVANGTSDATAYVSATAALIRAKYPNLSAGQVINRMIKSATPPNGAATPNDRYGYGILAPAKALEANPTVDGGPRENPLVGRKESQGAPPADDPTDSTSEEAVAPGADGGGSSGNGMEIVVVAAAGGLVLVVGVVFALVLRARRRGAGTYR
ncbi:type VII secretion-associated serine protease mycosin [Streptomyces sp. NRRL S-350]|uniref:type VII secretion-associated serine protease mycosin n=1 Tax=Streptomyces sp. NRRL S-350 TaxID=1463902 RepID=UPI00068BF446|nr:type VII secretion-associated serine protease mycosin [Streptomyces sp. NRRL S-350]